MKPIKQMTPLVTTDKLDALRTFYCEHLGFRPTFDSPGFLGLRSGKTEVGFMKPCEGQPTFGGAGVTICLEVENVDAEHDRLKTEGVEVTVPLRDNPWGDRSFTVVDPAGVALHIFRPIEPTEEFKQYIKQ
jgi:catechol 2,3-dioxygenase-like lactoylglutathione lyase family enzyme